MKKRAQLFLMLLVGCIQQSACVVLISQEDSVVLEHLLTSYEISKHTNDRRIRMLSWDETFHELVNDAKTRMPNLDVRPKTGWHSFAKVTCGISESQWFAVADNADIDQLFKTFARSVSFYTVRAEEKK